MAINFLNAHNLRKLHIFIFITILSSSIFSLYSTVFCAFLPFILIYLSCTTNFQNLIQSIEIVNDLLKVTNTSKTDFIEV